MNELIKETVQLTMSGDYEGEGVIVLHFSRFWSPPSLLPIYEGEKLEFPTQITSKRANLLIKTALWKSAMINFPRNSCPSTDPSLPKNYDPSPFIVARFLRWRRTVSLPETAFFIVRTIKNGTIVRHLDRSPECHGHACALSQSAVSLDVASKVPSKV